MEAMSVTLGAVCALRNEYTQVLNMACRWERGHTKAWIGREYMCPYCGTAHSDAGALREHVRCSCPCIEDDYIPAQYTRFAKQRDYNMDPRYEALSDVSLPAPHPCSL